MDKTKIFEAAGKFASKGQLDKAAKEYQRILEEDPKDVRALQKLAEIHQKAGKTKESTDLMLRVAEGYTEQGFFLKAVAVYKQILKVGPERIEVNQKLAQLYQQLGLIGDATQQYQVVANHYDKLGNVKESLAALRRMVDLDPDNVASQVKLGELYAREQMNTEAIAELRKAAQFLKRNNRPDDFVRVLERIGQLAPDDAAVARELAQSFLAHGDTKRALGRLQVCFRADPKDVETLQLLARAFSDLGQDAKTVSVYRELAKVHSERGATDAERDTLQRILEIAPEDEESVGRLRALAAAHAPQAVIAMAPPPGTVRAAPAPAPVAPAAPAPPRVRPPTPGLSASITKILTETDVYLKYGLVPKAAEHIRKALGEDPRCLDAHEKLLAILDRQGKTDEALAELVKMVEFARAAGNAERDGAYTQDLAQRSPDHALVRAAAAAAVLPEIEEDEVIIEPEDGHSIPPGDDDESIEIDTETTAPPVRPASLHSRPPLATASIPPSAVSLSGQRSSFNPQRELSIAPGSGSLGPRNPFTSASEGSMAPGGRAPWDPPAPADHEEEVVVEPDSMEPFEQPGNIPAEPAQNRFVAAAFDRATNSHRREPVSIAPMDPFAIEDDPPFAPSPSPFAAREPTRAPQLAPSPFPTPGPFTRPERTGGLTTPPGRGEPATGRPGPMERERTGGIPPDASGPWSLGRLDVPSIRPPPALYGNEEAFPPADAPPEHLPTVAATSLDESEAPPPGDLETTSELKIVSEASSAGEADASAEGLSDTFTEEMAEAEFLVQQGLVDDARRALEAILAHAPGHEPATALMNTLPPEEGAETPEAFPEHAAESVWKEESLEGAAFPPSDSMGGFNLGKELAGEFDSIAPPAASEAVPQHSVKDMLAEFKKKLSVTVSAEDSQTHYDLGIAYKEMGLFDEATHEFEVALQGRGRRRVVDCLIMLGVCRLEKGVPGEAVVHFEKALKTPGLTLEASKEAHFEIGVCLELLEDERGALDHYARVYKADQNFRDVKVRVAQLTQKVRAAGAADANGAGLKNGVTHDEPAEASPATVAAEPKGPSVSGISRGVRGKIGYI